MSRKHKRLGRRTNGPPENERWIWHSLGLLESDAWRGRSVHCRKLIDFLELEHVQHVCLENGRLLAPYNQLEVAGIGRKYIAGAIREAEQRGLVRIERGGRKGSVMAELNRFTLTYYWVKHKHDGLWDWQEPTDDWQQFREEGLPGLHRKGASIGSPFTTVTVHNSPLVTVHNSPPPPAQPIEIVNAHQVAKREQPLLYSGEGTDYLPNC